MAAHVLARSTGRHRARPGRGDPRQAPPV